MYKKDFLPFEEARALVKSLQLNNLREWITYCKSGQRPANIPASPDASYKDQGWINWGDFLGTGNIDKKKKEFLSFQQARAYARSLELKSYRQWLAYCKSGKRAVNIPYSPEDYYQANWKGWQDWLGYKHEGFLPFHRARKYVRSLKLKSYNEWQMYKKSAMLPKTIPMNPERVYRDKGWISTPDWLGYV